MPTTSTTYSLTPYWAHVLATNELPVTNGLPFMQIIPFYNEVTRIAPGTGLTREGHDFYIQFPAGHKELFATEDDAVSYGY